MPSSSLLCAADLPVASLSDAVNEPDFAALVTRESRFVFQVAYSLLRNVTDAEDVVQDTFLRVYRNGAWRDMRDDRAFLARVAWRLSVDRKRKQRHQAPTPELISAASDPESAAIAAGREQALERLIAALPEKLRLPLVLSTVEALTSPQIAVILGIPEGTVRTRLMRAREILKRDAAGWIKGERDAR